MLARECFREPRSEAQSQTLNMKGRSLDATSIPRFSGQEMEMDIRSSLHFHPVLVQ